MKYLMLMMTVLVLSACRSEKEPEINAQYLVLNNCRYTGESFVQTDKVWNGQGRTGQWLEQENRYYVYICAPGNSKKLSLVRLVIDKENI